MHSEQSFVKLMDTLEAAGVDPSKSEDYALAIGDTPVIEDGLVLIYGDGGEVIDRVAIPGI